MRNKYFKKIFVSLVLIMVLGVISAGCGVVAPPTNPPPPATYTITVMSGSGAVFGSVYVNGLPTGDYVAAWGGATVSGVPSGAAIYIIDPFGWVSHTEIFNPANGLVVVFNWF
jgi:hypothetical protein